MTPSRYDFEGLWFETYRKVLRHNETLGDQGLDKSHLREVTTSIFIAQSQRGIVRPLALNGFVDSVLKSIAEIRERPLQEAIYKGINEIIKQYQKGGHHATL